MSTKNTYHYAIDGMDKGASNESMTDAEAWDVATAYAKALGSASVSLWVMRKSGAYGLSFIGTREVQQ